MTPDPRVDPAFPRLHGRPPRGWLNDPAGLAFLDDRYHLFFQHNPASVGHEAITWGHVTSGDLLTWRTEPLALVPRPGEADAHGCWTGCLTVADGEPTIVYSAVLSGDGRSVVLLATPERDDLSRWRQGSRPATAMPTRLPPPGVTDVRDPYVVHVQGRRYAIQGAGQRGARHPRVLLYDATDLTAWSELGDLVDLADPVVRGVCEDLLDTDVWECPNLVRIGGSWVLVLSHLPAGTPTAPAGRPTMLGVHYLVGDLVDRGDGHPRFVPRASGLLDSGPAFYAPQLLTTADRILMWAWSWEERPEADVVAAGWAGCLTWCRELTLAGEVLVSRPARELSALRGGMGHLRSGGVLEEQAFEVALPQGPGRLWLDGPNGSVEVARWQVSENPLSEPRLLVDGSMIELFDGGPWAHTARAYPGSGSCWRVEVDAQEDLTWWPLTLP